MSYTKERFMDDLERGDEPTFDEREYDASKERLEGYPPGHYKSWNGDIPDVPTDY